MAALATLALTTHLTSGFRVDFLVRRCPVVGTTVRRRPTTASQL